MKGSFLHAVEDLQSVPSWMIRERGSVRRTYPFSLFPANIMKIRGAFNFQNDGAGTPRSPQERLSEPASKGIIV